MAGLLDELRASAPRRVGCSVCLFLSLRPAPEQEEWEEAFADPTISNTAIYRAMKAREFSGLSPSPVARHRNESH